MNLLVLARAGARRAPNAWLRAVVLALGSFGIALAVIACALGAARVDGALTRAYADDPIRAASPEQTRVRVSRTFGMVGDAPVTVIGVSDVVGDVHPPGVRRLPRPGEAVLSDQLLADLGRDVDRYGTVVGRIDPAALETPTERRVYVGLRHSPAEAVAATGFGPQAGSYDVGTGVLYQPARSMIMLTVLLTIGLGGLAATVVGAGISSRSRLAIARALDTAGSGWRDRLSIGIGADGLPLLAGACAAAAVTIPLLVRDTPVPLTRTTLAAADAKQVLWAWPAAVVAALCIGTLLCVARMRTRGSGRPRRQLLSTTAGGLLGLASLVVLRPLLGLVPPTFQLLLFIAGVLASALLLPRLIAWVLAAVGVLVARAALRAGAPGSLVAGRQLAAHPRRVAALATPVVVGVLVLALACLWGGVLGRQESAARHSMALAQNRLVEISLDQPATPALVEQLRHPGPGVDAVLVTPTDGPSGIDTVTAPCPGLLRLGLACASGRQRLPDVGLAAALAGWVGPLVDVRPGPVPDSTGTAPTLYLVGEPGAVDLGRTTRAVLAAGSPGTQVGWVGQQWTVASSTSATQARWLTLLGAICLMLVVLAFGLAAVAALGEQVGESAAVLRWADRLPPLLALAWWRGAMPYAVAFLAADAAASWFATVVHDTDHRFVLPSGFHPTVRVLAVVLTALLGLAALVVMRTGTGDDER